MDRMSDPDRSTGAAVSGADNTDGVLRITVDNDGTGPADLWLAAIDHITAESERLLAAMAAEVGPSTNTVIAGGWTRMSSIRRAKTASLPHVRYSDRSQAGAFGAALFAAHAVDAAAVLAAAGNPDAVGIDEPSGPTQEFAAAFRRRTPHHRPGRGHCAGHHPNARGDSHMTSTTDQTTTAAKTLADIATEQNTFAIVAMDQRNTLKRMYKAVGVEDPSQQEMTEIKADTVAALRGTASAFLLDPTYGTRR